MISLLIGLMTLAPLAAVLRWLGRRAWARMGGHTPSPHDRSQRQNRQAAEAYYDRRPQVQQARFARRRTMKFDS